MKSAGIALALLLAAGSAAAQDVDVGTGDWSGVPALQALGQYRMGDVQMDAIERIAASRRCDVPGLGRTAVDLRVPFVIRYGAEGRVEQVVLRELGCPQLETVLGSAVVQLTLAGEYQRPEEREGWYRGEISFANE